VFSPRFEDVTAGEMRVFGKVLEYTGNLAGERERGANVNEDF
jgi:hypothetical protein